MATKLTKKEKGFSDDFLETGNGTLAALNNYDVSNENTAASIASQNLRKLKIQNYIAEHAEEAELMIYTLSQTSKQDNIRLSASKDILDRAGYGAVSKSENKSLVLNLEGKITTEEQDTIRAEYEAKIKESYLK